MDSNDYSSIFKNSLNDVIVQIDLFCQSPDVFPVTVTIIVNQSDHSNPHEYRLKTCIALTNYFLGIFEGIARTRLSNIHNIMITKENKGEYLTALQPFFDELTKKHLNKLCTDKILDIFLKRGNSPFK